MKVPAISYWSLQLLLGWINFAMTAPMIYLYLGLPLVMRQQGWSGTAIGLFQLAGLPAVLKFVLAAPVDRWARDSAGYRRWSIVLLVGYAASLGVLASLDIETAGFSSLFTLAMLASLLGTWADAPVNALAIRCLPESERMRAGTIRSAASSLGAVFGGGAMLLLHDRVGWSWPFWVMGTGLLLAVVGLCLVPSVRLTSVLGSIQKQRVGVRQWVGYFAAAQRRRWLVVLMLYFPFIGTAWVYLKPLLLDQGLSSGQVVVVAGLLGGVVGALGSLLGGYVTYRRGLRYALPGCAMLALFALAALSVALVSHAGLPLLTACTVLLALAMGASAGLVFGMMMYYTREGLTAVDYGLQSSLFVLTRTLVPMLAGVLLDHLGYLSMLGALMVGMLGVGCWSLLFVRNMGEMPSQVGRGTG